MKENRVKELATKLNLTHISIWIVTVEVISNIQNRLIRNFSQFTQNTQLSLTSALLLSINLHLSSTIV